MKEKELSEYQKGLIAGVKLAQQYIVIDNSNLESIIIWSVVYDQLSKKLLEK